MTDKDLVSQVERYYCKQQRVKWHAFVIGCLLTALTLFGHDWLSRFDDAMPTIFAMSAGFCFSLFIINYWGTPADKLLGEAMEVLAKTRNFRR